MRSFRSGLRNPIQHSGDRLGAGGMLGQRFVLASENVVVPVLASFVFAEVQAKGGDVIGGSAYRKSAGGAGTDAIFSVKGGDVIAVSLGYAAGDAAQASSITCGGVTISADSPPGSNADRQSGVAGKYPGSRADPSDPANLPGKGTGRLAGAVGGTSGYGGGVMNTFNAESLKGGRPIACLTFFASYDEALAFAKAVYGGTWAP